MSTESRIDKRAKQYIEKKYGRTYIRKIGSGSNGRTGVYLTEKTLASVREKSALKVVSVIERLGKRSDYTPEEIDFFRKQRKELIDSSVAEVAIMQKLGDSKHIVRYLDFDAINYENEDSFGTDLAIRMQLLNNLAESMAAKKYGWTSIVHIGMHLCLALSECHGNRIIHRDIKPANIFFDEGEVFKLGDFGVSKILRHSLTENAPIGTFSYAAPEQVKGDNYDHRIDIYSLGLVLYELANNNKLPFAKTSQAQTSEINKRLHYTEKLPPPPGVPSQLKAVIVKACAYRPEDRYQSAREFYEALKTAREQIQKELDEKKRNILEEKKRRPDPRNNPGNQKKRPQTRHNAKKQTGLKNRKKKPGNDRNILGSLVVIGLGILAVGLIVLAVIYIINNAGDRKKNDTPETQQDTSIVIVNDSGSAGSAADDNSAYTPVSEAAAASVSTYELVLEDVSWDRAYLSCQEKGGHLVRIETEEEMIYIMNWLDEQNILTDGSKLLYIAAQRQLDSQNYFWVNDDSNLYGSTPINDSGSWTSGYWYLNEPSFQDGDTLEYCLDLFNKDGYWYLNDVPGDIVSYASMYAGKVGYICEYETA